MVTAAFVRLPQKVKCPVLGNHLFNLDSVQVLLGNSMIKLFSIILISGLNSLIKTRSSAENNILLLFMLFLLHQQTSLMLEQLQYVSHIGNGNILLSIFNT